MTAQAERSTMSLWMQAVRAFSFTASITPVLLGAALALSFNGTVYWYLLPLIAVCSVMMHAATNLVSDYFDFKRGVDTKESYGSSRILVDGLLAPSSVYRVGLLLFAITFVLGLFMVVERGTPVLILGVIGIFGGYFYCGGGSAAYKYFAVGDVLVFLLMGPLMVCGSYYVLTGTINDTVIYASLPIGCLVAAILIANNIRDISHDRKANLHTVATLLGPSASRWEYILIVVAAFVIVIVLVALKMLSPWTLLVLLSFPPALKNLRAIRAADPMGAPEAIAMTDVHTAQHHFLFGALYSIGCVLAHWF